MCVRPGEGSERDITRRGLCLSHHPLSPPRPASPLSFFLPHSLSKFENHVDAKFDLLIEGLNETYQKIEGAKGAVEVRREMRGEGERERAGGGERGSSSPIPPSPSPLHPVPFHRPRSRSPSRWWTPRSTCCAWSWRTSWPVGWMGWLVDFDCVCVVAARVCACGGVGGSGA